MRKGLRPRCGGSHAGRQWRQASPCSQATPSRGRSMRRPAQAVIVHGVIGVLLNREFTEVTFRLVAVYTVLHFGVFAVLGVGMAWVSAAFTAPPRLLLALGFGVLLQEATFYVGLLLLHASHRGSDEPVDCPPRSPCAGSGRNQRAHRSRGGGGVVLRPGSRDWQSLPHTRGTRLSRVTRRVWPRRGRRYLRPGRGLHGRPRRRVRSRRRRVRWAGGASGARPRDGAARAAYRDSTRGTLPCDDRRRGPVGPGHHRLAAGGGRECPGRGRNGVAGMADASDVAASVAGASTASRIGESQKTCRGAACCAPTYLRGVLVDLKDLQAPQSGRDDQDARIAGTARRVGDVVHRLKVSEAQLAAHRDGLLDLRPGR